MARPITRPNYDTGERIDPQFDTQTAGQWPPAERGSNEDRRRKKACTGKVKYCRFAYAEAAIEEITAREGVKTLQSYVCPYCGYWHTGHILFSHFMNAQNQSGNWGKQGSDSLADIRAVQDFIHGLNGGQCINDGLPLASPRPPKAH